MIQFYKLKEDNQQVWNHLNKVTPWWNKTINRKIRKAKRIALKFGLNPNDFIKFNSIEETNFIDLTKGINNYLNFYIPKLKIIVSNRDAFKKFDGSIINYMTLNGNVSAIQTIAQFYDSISNNEVILLTKNNALNFCNHMMAGKWNRYKKEIISTFGGNEEIKNNLKKTFDEIIEFKKEIFDTRVIISWIVKYASRLFKANEITEKQFLNVMYLSYLELSYIEGFIDVYKKFIENLK